MFFFKKVLHTFFIFIFFNFLVFNSISFLDAPLNYQIGLQEPATPIMEGINSFHNHIFYFMVGIGTFVFWLLTLCIVLFKQKEDVPASSDKIDNFTHSTSLEIIWTLVPAVILMLIAIPSFALLYSMDELLDPAFTFKTIAHQWYWSYEYSNHYGVHFQFDSYMLEESALPVGGLRLLEVDNRVLLPEQNYIRFLVTSADVLHSWAVPSFGIKLDACPGRLNQTSLYINREGTFYGQCSEICGINHGFMPIVVTSLKVPDFLEWYNGVLLWLLANSDFSDLSENEE